MSNIRILIAQLLIAKIETLPYEKQVKLYEEWQKRQLKKKSIKNVRSK